MITKPKDTTNIDARTIAANAKKKKPRKNSLFGTSDQTGESVVYIGQAGVRKNGEGILYRLQEHKRNPDKDDAVVEYALRRSISPALVANYQLHLPNKKLLENKLREISEIAKSLKDEDVSDD